MNEGNSDTDDESADEESTRPWYERRDSWRRRALDKLSEWTGGWIPSAHLLEMKAFYRSRDTEENDDARPEVHQHVETRALWFTEVYTPATVGTLTASLERIARRGGRIGNQDPAGWVRAQRHRDGSYLELYLSPAGAGHFLSGFEIEFPPFARTAHGTIWSATPSLTLITVTFELNDVERRRFDEILHGNHPTRFIPNRRSISIMTPELERRHLISEARARWRKEAAAWFGKHLPGLLHATAEGLPSGEFSVLTGIEPFPVKNDAEDGRRRDFHTRTALGMSHDDLFVRTKEDRPDIRFAPLASSDEEEYRHAIVAMTEEAYRSIPADHYGSDDARHLRAIDRSLRGMLAQWAIFRLLRHFEDRAAAIRDRFSQIIGGARATSALARVRKDTADCADAAIIAREVAKGVEDGFLLARGYDMMSRPLSKDLEPRPMRKVLGGALQRVSEQLLIQLKELNDALHAQASLLSAHANQRLQPWIILLAIVSAITGALAAIEPVRELVKSNLLAAPSARSVPPSNSDIKPEKPASLTEKNVIERDRATRSQPGK